MKTLQNKIDMNNEVKNNPTRFDAHYYAELLVAPWFEDNDPRLFEFGDVVVKAFKCCPANGFTEKAAGWLVSYEQVIDGHTQAHTEHVTTEVLALQLAELYRVKADEKEPREDISEGMTVYPDDCLAEWHGRAAKVVRRWLADWGTWCLELEFSDGTRHDYAEKYVTTTQPWSVVGATCHHRWADNDVVLTVTAVGQYYGIKAESEDGKVKRTGLARDFVPCTPDGRDLLPEPPAEVHIDAEPTLENSGEIKPKAAFQIGDRVERKSDGERGTVDGYDVTDGKLTYIVKYDRTQRRQSDGFEYLSEELNGDELQADCIESRKRTIIARAKQDKQAWHYYKGYEVRVRKAYTNESSDPKDWTYCVSWYADGQLVECENGVRLEQAARALNDLPQWAEARKAA